MPVIRGPIAEEGSLIKVTIGWNHARLRKLRQAGRPVPSSVEVMALLDTGALDSRVIEELDLPFEGAVIANAPALQEVGFTSQYAASLTILHPSGQKGDHLLVTDLPVMELPLNVLGYQVLLGRDVLSQCRFLYDGIGATFTLKY